MRKKLAIAGGKPVRTKPWPPWPYFWDDEKQAVQEVLESGKVNYWTGRKGREFQDKFAEYCGAKHAIAVANGTAALHVALAAANIGPGDEVIVPCRTFIATACSVLNQNAIPIFADVDIATQNISVESIKEKVTERTKAIIAVHLAGHPANMDPIREIAKEHDLIVIEDAAQAPGAEYKGKKVGNLGHVAAFSFCNDKIFTTGGEGGMVTTNSDEMAQIGRSFKDHGYHEKERRSLLELEALYTYIHHRMGYNYRMTEMQAAIGLKALEKLNWNVEKRRGNAHYLTEKLSAFVAIIPAYESTEIKHGFYKYYGRLKLDQLSFDRDTFVKAVQAEGVPIGIGTSSENYLEEVFQKWVGYGKTGCPFKCPLYKGKVDYTNISLPNARQLSKEAFVLQVHPTIEKNDLDDVIKAITKVAEIYGK